MAKPKRNTRAYWNRVERRNPFSVVGKKIPSHCCPGKREKVEHYDKHTGDITAWCDCGSQIQRKGGEDLVYGVTGAEVFRRLDKILRLPEVRRNIARVKRALRDYRS